MYLPGLALSSATSSATVLTLSSGLTASALGCVTSCVIGAMSLARIVGQLGEQQRVDGERPADADADGGAVGRGLGDRVGAEIAAGARLVLDHEGAVRIFLRKPVGDQARHDVGRRARLRTAR